MHSDTSQVATALTRWWQAAWSLPALLNPWQWAERELEFSVRVSPMPGPYRTGMVPYVREPLESFHDPGIRKIVLCWSAQSSKTTTMQVALAYTIANAPGPALFVMPSLEMARSFSENRLIPLIEDCPALSIHKTGDRHDFKKGVVYLQTIQGEVHRTRYRSLTELMTDLSPSFLFQVHRSMIVNLKAIRGIKDRFEVDVELRTHHESVYPSRRLMPSLRKALGLVRKFKQIKSVG